MKNRWIRAAVRAVVAAVAFAVIAGVAIGLLLLVGQGCGLVVEWLATKFEITEKTAAGLLWGVGICGLFGTAVAGLYFDDERLW